MKLSGNRQRPAGSNAKRAIAITTGLAVAAGGAVIASPAFAADEAITLVSSADTTWNYLDDNTDPAGSNEDVNVWTKTAFDDATWKSAKGSFGAKNGAKTGIGTYTANTLLRQYINGTSAPDTKTFFFRADIELTTQQLAGIDGLAGSLIHDDAVRVFVNGTKVLGVDDSAVTTNLQYAGVAAGDPKTSNVSVDKSLLHAGTNTVAVALYQDRDTSSDVYFDMTSLTTVPTPDEPVAASVTDLVLTIGADETKRNLAWATDSGVAEVVQLAKKSELVDGAFPANATTFAATSETSNQSGFTARKASIANLEESTTYAYRVGSESRGWSDAHEFATQKFDGDYSFLLVGDPQIGASGNVAADQLGWEKTLDSAETAFPNTEFIYSAGDQVEHAANESEYDAFLAPSQLTKYALAPINGNHDVGSKAYEQHYNTPNWDPTAGAASNGSSSGGDYWYFYKDVLFITLNSNSQDTASHKAFLEKVVAEQGAKAKWKVVGFHHSIYSVASHANDTDIIARRSVLPTILSDLDIDLVLMGHDHVYTRSYLINDGVVAEPAGAKPVVKAKDGDVLYVTANSASGSKYYDIRNQTYDFAAVTNQEKIRNFSNIEVTDGSLRVRTYRSDLMTIVDDVTLEKADAVKPELTVPADGDVAFGSTFDALAGVSATDNVDGDITSSITVDGAVDTSVLGEYELSYAVTDAAGNTTSKTRTVTVVNGEFGASPAPVLIGTARVGQTLAAATPSWSPAAAFTFTWKADGETIAGESGSALVVKGSLAGKRITVSVTGTREGVDEVTKTSEATAVIAKATLTSKTPKVSGTAKVGTTLTATTGTWSPTPGYSYQWYANGSAIKGATSSTFVLTKSQVGKAVKVRVTGTLEGYTSKSVYSSTTSKVKK
jgi:hypothetical protein